MPSLALVYRRPAKWGTAEFTCRASQATGTFPSIPPLPTAVAGCNLHAPLLFKSSPARHVAFPRPSASPQSISAPALAFSSWCFPVAHAAVPFRHRRRAPPGPGCPPRRGQHAALGTERPGLAGTNLGVRDEDRMRCAADSVTFSDSNLAGGMLLCWVRKYLGVYPGHH